MIKNAQASMPAAMFNQDMSSAVDMRDEFPPQAFDSTVNSMMTGQITNTVADKASFPDAADQFDQNGLASMNGAIDTLHRGGAIDSVQPQTWNAMSGMSPNITSTLGFDPADVASNPELASSLVAQSRPQSQPGVSVQGEAQAGVDAAHTAASGAKAASSLTDKVSSSVEDVAHAGAGVVKDEAKVAGKVASEAGKVASEGGNLATKGLGAVGDLAKSPVGKIAGKAALPLGLVGGAIALGGDADKFGSAITDPFNSEKRDEAIKALREDSPIPGTPLVLDALTDPGKLADTAKDVGKVFTDPGVDSLKNAGKSILDEFGF